MKTQKRPMGYSINIRERTQSDGSTVYLADIRVRLARRRFAHVSHCESPICEHALEMATSIVVGRLVDGKQ